MAGVCSETRVSGLSQGHYWNLLVASTNRAVLSLQQWGLSC